MKAVVATEGGGPEVLAMIELPDPTPGPGEVLIKVMATSVNRADVLQRGGKYQLPPNSSAILGLEVAGVVVECADDAGPWSPGDRVFGLTAGGGYAELVAMPAAVLMSIPSNLDFEEAAAIPEVFTTAYDNLILRARAGYGSADAVLIHGGSSGVGTAAIQLAARAGCRVFVTAGSERKLVACRALGAEVGINYHEQDFVSVVKDHTSGRGVDIILDHIGASYLQRNLESLGMDGRLVIIGTLGGKQATIDLANIASYRHVVTGSRMRPRSVEEKGILASKVSAELLPAFQSGELRPVIDRVLPLSEVAVGHALMEESSHVGKIVLRVSE